MKLIKRLLCYNIIARDYSWIIMLSKLYHYAYKIVFHNEFISIANTELTRYKLHFICHVIVGHKMCFKRWNYEQPTLFNGKSKFNGEL